MRSITLSLLIAELFPFVVYSFSSRIISRILCTVYFSAVYSASWELYGYVEAFPSYYFFNGLLILLQILHIIWTYMILRIAAQKLFHNKVYDMVSLLCVRY